MGVLDSLQANIRKIILMDERLKRLAEKIEKLESRVEDHNIRLVRVETIIDIARDRARGRLPPPDDAP